jgi:prepilin-type N-terminal cleavage/methylation domain-containing protein
MKSKGFTLIELVVVISVIAILSAVAIVGFRNFIGVAKDTKAQEVVRTIKMDLALKIGDQPGKVNITKNGNQQEVRINYDFENDAFTFVLVNASEHFGTLISANEAKTALIKYFELIMDQEKWAINPLEPTPKDVLNVNVDVNGNVTIDYLRSEGGTFKWEAKGSLLGT